MRDIKSPIKKDLDIFGFRGSKKAEHNKMAERKDLKTIGNSVRLGLFLLSNI